jgi:AraC-like DNA-binding protein
MSFLQYLKTIRMVRAIEMILKTTDPIGEIAFKLGYSSIASFSDSLLEFTNSRPSDLRRTKQQNSIGIMKFHANKTIADRYTGTFHIYPELSPQDKNCF